MIRFIQRQLDPADILAELLFGLIMVLTFTLGAAAAGGYERGLLLAAIGCNVAWGVIDAVLVVLGSRYARRRAGRLIRRVRGASDEAAALAAVREELESELLAVTRPEDREPVYRSMRALLARAQPPTMRLRGDDFLTGLAVFVLVVATALPAALPFFVVEDPHRALRLSNALLVVLLFGIGYAWGRHIEVRPWLSALTFAALGVGLVAIAIALGG